MSTIKKILVAAVLCCLFGVSSMYADSFVGGGSCTIGPITAGTLGSCGSGITGFNASWGTLESISITLTGVSGSIQGVAANSSTATVAVTGLIATETLTINFPGSGGADLLTAPAEASTPCSFNVGPGTTGQHCGSPTAFTVAGTAASGTFFDVADFTNGGVAIAGSQFFAADTASASGFGGGGGTVTYGPDGTITGVITVTYDYATGIPEPATMLLMGGALMGLGVIARKRQRKS